MFFFCVCVHDERHLLSFIMAGNVTAVKVSSEFELCFLALKQKRANVPHVIRNSSRYPKYPTSLRKTVD